MKLKLFFIIASCAFTIKLYCMNNAILENNIDQVKTIIEENKANISDEMFRDYIDLAFMRNKTQCLEYLLSQTSDQEREFFLVSRIFDNNIDTLQYLLNNNPSYNTSNLLKKAVFVANDSAIRVLIDNFQANNQDNKEAFDRYIRVRHKNKTMLITTYFWRDSRPPFCCGCLAERQRETIAALRSYNIPDTSDFSCSNEFCCMAPFQPICGYECEVKKDGCGTVCCCSVGCTIS